MKIWRHPSRRAIPHSGYSPFAPSPPNHHRPQERLHDNIKRRVRRDLGRYREDMVSFGRASIIPRDWEGWVSPGDDRPLRVPCPSLSRVKRPPEMVVASVHVSTDARSRSRGAEATSSPMTIRARVPVTRTLQSATPQGRAARAQPGWRLPTKR